MLLQFVLVVAKETHPDMTLQAHVLGNMRPNGLAINSLSAGCAMLETQIESNEGMPHSGGKELRMLCLKGRSAAIFQLPCGN